MIQRNIGNHLPSTILSVTAIYNFHVTFDFSTPVCTGPKHSTKKCGGFVLNRSNQRTQYLNPWYRQLLRNFGAQQEWKILDGSPQDRKYGRESGKACVATHFNQRPESS